MSATTRALFCKRADRHAPKLVCGYPLPCPHHTLTIDAESNATVIPPSARLTPKTRERISQISEALRTTPLHVEAKAQTYDGQIRLIRSVAMHLAHAYASGCLEIQGIKVEDTAEEHWAKLDPSIKRHWFEQARAVFAGDIR